MFRCHSTKGMDWVFFWSCSIQLFLPFYSIKQSFSFKNYVNNLWSASGFFYFLFCLETSGSKFFFLIRLKCSTITTSLNNCITTPFRLMHYYNPYLCSFIYLLIICMSVHAHTIQADTFWGRLINNVLLKSKMYPPQHTSAFSIQNFQCYFTAT